MFTFFCFCFLLKKGFPKSQNDIRSKRSRFAAFCTPHESTFDQYHCSSHNLQIENVIHGNHSFTSTQDDNVNVYTKAKCGVLLFILFAAKIYYQRGLRTQQQKFKLISASTQNFT